jgi:hypothetical protein
MISSTEGWAVGGDGVILRYSAGGEPSEPTLAINYATGAPGSYFTITGSDFPQDGSVPIAINDHQLGTTQADESGSFTLLLTTDNADAGQYVVTLGVCFICESICFCEPSCLTNRLPSKANPKGLLRKANSSRASSFS